MAKTSRKENPRNGATKDLLNGGTAGQTLIYQANCVNNRVKSTSSLESHVEWMKQNSLAIIMIVLPILLIAVMMGWIVVPWFIHQQVANKVVISPDASPELYAAWVHPPVPVHLKVYLFNVTNSEQVRKGALPTLQELGPYVFRENRTKIQIHHHDATDTVTYKERISYHFESELSKGASLQDSVTIINVPFAAAAIKISELPWPINGIALSILLGFKEKLFIQRTVEDILFKGWKVNFLEKIEQELDLSLIPNNTFGYFVGLNNTAQGPYTISRGTYDKDSFGRIVKFKNETELAVWGDRSTPCNQIRGTDGTLFHPFLTKSTVLRLFNAELCRSLSLIYYEDINFKGIDGYRFAGSPEHLMSPAVNHENQCYCSEWDHDPDKCLKQGTFDLGPCRDGAPVAMSAPHFLDADPEYGEKSGLTPEEDKHITYIKVEPLTGIILEASKKIQINLMLKRVKGVSALSKVPDMLFPLVWADECAYLDPENADKLKSILFLVWLLDFISKWVVLAVALIASVFFITRKVRAQSFTEQITSSANENWDSNIGKMNKREDDTEFESGLESQSTQEFPLTHKKHHEKIVNSNSRYIN